MLAPPVKIRHSHRFPFAFLQLLFFLPPPSPPLTLHPPPHQGWGDEASFGAGRGEQGHLTSGQDSFSQCISKRKSLPDLCPVTVARCFSGWSISTAVFPEELRAVPASECPPRAACLGALMIHCPHQLKSKIPACRGQEVLTGFGLRFTAENCTYSALYTSGQYLVMKPLSSGSIHSLSWKNIGDVCVLECC